MTGVVLRCPHCGTTQERSGDCEACHEAQVKYFCSNHNPGRWLDAPRCSECGARFGDRVRAPPKRPPPETPSPISPSRRASAEPDVKPMPGRPGPWEMRRRRARREDRIVVTEKRSRYERYEEPEVAPDIGARPESLEEFPRAAAALGGFLRRAVGIFFFLFFLLMLLSLFIGGTIMQVIH